MTTFRVRRCVLVLSSRPACGGGVDPAGWLPQHAGLLRSESIDLDLEIAAAGWILRGQITIYDSLAPGQGPLLSYLGTTSTHHTRNGPYW